MFNYSLVVVLLFALSARLQGILRPLPKAPWAHQLVMAASFWDWRCALERALLVIGQISLSSRGSLLVGVNFYFDGKSFERCEDTLSNKRRKNMFDLLYWRL
jgi:hypothetical protein